MTNSKELFNRLMGKIDLEETPDEIQSILYLVFEHRFGLTKTDILAGKEVERADSCDEIIDRINNDEPIQYILGVADFYGRQFIVTPSVMIPRTETELLVHDVIAHCLPTAQGTILDIGTGTGCIAISLAKELPNMKSVATDVSEDALKIAQVNADRFNVSIKFLCNDVLNDSLPLRNLDIIVSNPPYVSFREKSRMKKNVLLFEPPVAIFVPDDDPLVFYKAIASLAWKTLTSSGKVWVEINEQFGKEVVNIFSGKGFQQVSLRRDFSGKDRIVMASR